MLFLSDLVGTLQASFRIAGIKLANAGDAILEIRNKAGAFVALRSTVLWLSLPAGTNRIGHSIAGEPASDLVYLWPTAPGSAGYVLGDPTGTGVLVWIPPDTGPQGPPGPPGPAGPAGYEMLNGFFVDTSPVVIDIRNLPQSKWMVHLLGPYSKSYSCLITAIAQVGEAIPRWTESDIVSANIDVPDFTISVEIYNTYYLRLVITADNGWDYSVYVFSLT